MLELRVIVRTRAAARIRLTPARMSDQRTHPRLEITRAMTMLIADSGIRMSPTVEALRCLLCSIHWLAPYRTAQVPRVEHLAQVGALQRQVFGEHAEVDQWVARPSFPEDQCRREYSRYCGQPPGRRQQLGEEHQQACDRSGEQDDTRDVERREQPLPTLERNWLVLGHPGKGSAMLMSDRGMFTAKMAGQPNAPTRTPPSGRPNTTVI